MSRSPSRPFDTRQAATAVATDDHRGWRLTAFGGPVVTGRLRWRADASPPEIPASTDKRRRGEDLFVQPIHVKQLELGPGAQDEGFSLVVREENPPVHRDRRSREAFSFGFAEAPGL